MTDPTPDGTDRRTFLTLLAAGAGVAAAAPMLASCSSSSTASSAGTKTGSIQSGDKLANLVPTFKAANYVQPELPSVNGSAAGYLSYPTSPVKSVPTVPGKGSSFTAMTPAWWAIPRSDNAFYKAVNAELGASIKFNVVNGNDYGTKIAAIFASKRVPDILCLPLWEGVKPQNFSGYVGALFEDLTPYLAGDISAKWPNLANLPTRAWEFSVFNGKLYGLPFPGGLIADVLFYRDDLFKQLGVEPPKSADDWLALAKEVTDAKKGRWACGDVFEECRRMYGVPFKWERQNGKLLYQYETDAYAAAVEFNRKLYAGGYVHPDVVAKNTATSKDLFESGKFLMYEAGIGGWHEALERQRPSNPTFSMAPFPPFAADPAKKPIYWAADPAGIMGFVKKGLGKDKVEEILGLMNYIAAPYGTHEYDLLTNGPRGVDSKTSDTGVPQLTDQGKKEVTYTYSFLVGRPDIVSEPLYPDYVKANHSWQVSAAAYLSKGVLDGLNVEEPPKYASLYKQFDDKLQDILRGRAPMTDLATAVSTWQKNGGNALRDFYEKQLSAAGR